MNILNVAAGRSLARLARFRSMRLAGILVMANVASACVTPDHMHVTEGIAPQHVDTHVRFRTTYYFRVFDYCWAGDTAGTYRKIVPETDTLYRYRMTGKAPSLTNRIKFESGVLDANVIAPFGADVVYNSDINGYLVRSQDQAREQAKTMAVAREAQARRDAALTRFETLARMHADTTPAQVAQAEQLAAAMKDSLADYTGTLSAPATSEVMTRLGALQAAVDRLEAKGLVNAPGAVPMSEADLERMRKAFAEEVARQVAGLRNIAPTSDACTANVGLKRGFQIMGPEGMRPFDQEQRLVMAMSSSAKPLIETLNEYSGRILRPQVNPAEQLLPLARETTFVLDAQRAVYQEALLVEGRDPAVARISSLFDAAATAFTPGVK